ncbi:hypothetical protein EJ110_NYTH24138 [Nymphaea thermarum]|nr:hypothetical protein EJ110_NYTH24138 [Nymphaea thermarum]
MEGSQYLVGVPRPDSFLPLLRSSKWMKKTTANASSTSIFTFKARKGPAHCGTPSSTCALKQKTPRPTNSRSFPCVFKIRCCAKDKSEKPAVASNSTSPPAPRNAGLATETAASEGLVFDLGSNGSWDSCEIGSPIVRRYLSDDEERWHMWYHGRAENLSDSVGLTVSSNGIHWERGPASAKTAQDVGQVMRCSNDWWAFDTQSIRPSDVLIMSSSKIRASSGVYWLYYTGFSSETVEVSGYPRLPIQNPDRNYVEALGYDTKGVVYKSLPGLAISQDGRHWARIEGEHHSGALFDVGDEGEWDSSFIAAPQVVGHSGDDLRMYYHSFDLRSGVFCVGVARSRDGIRWVKLGKIMGGGPPGSFDELGVTARHVVRNTRGGGYVMVYEGIARDGRRRIGVAESADGLKQWKRRDEPVLQPSVEDNGWDNHGVGNPCLVQMDGAEEWRLYYRGTGKSGRTGIGMATSGGNGISSFRRWKGFHL